MDLIAAMSAFVRVVEAGSFTGAASRCDLPKTTVTRLVNELEHELQTRLLVRSSRSLVLTPEGVRLHTRALRFLAQLQDLEAQTRQSIARPSGAVRVELTTALARMVVVPALGEFLERYPDVQVTLEEGLRSQSLVADNIDCALRLGAPDDQLLVARCLGEFRCVTCASPGYLERLGKPGSVHELSTNYRMLGLLLPGNKRPLPFSFQDGEVELELAPSGQYTFSDANTYLAAALAGLGLIQLPAYAVHPALESGALLPVLEDCAIRRTGSVYIAYPPNRYLSAKVRVFIDWLVVLFERNPCLRRQ